jgi:hypothetical protein
MGHLADSGNKSYAAVRIGDNANLLDGEALTFTRTGTGAFTKVLEWDDDAAGTAGAILVDIGADEAGSIENLRDAINDAPTLKDYVVAYVDPVDTSLLRIEGKEPGSAGNLGIESTMLDAQNVIAEIDDAFAGGGADASRSRAADEYIVTALDVDAQNVMIPTPFQSPKLGRVMVLTSADVPKYVTDKIKINGTRLQVQKNGATNLAETDRIFWEVWSGS